MLICLGFPVHLSSLLLVQGVRSVIIKVAGRGVCISKLRASFDYGQ